jgi:hypothetical protein
MSDVVKTMMDKLNQLDKHKRDLDKHKRDWDKLKPKLRKLAKRLSIEEKSNKKK